MSTSGLPHCMGGYFSPMHKPFPLYLPQPPQVYVMSWILKDAYISYWIKYLSIYLVLIEWYQNTQCTTVRAVLAAKGGYTHLTQYYAGGHNVMLDRCRLHDAQSGQNKDQLLKDISQGYEQN